MGYTLGRNIIFVIMYIYPLYYHKYFHFPYAPIYAQKLVALDAKLLYT